MRNSWMAWGVVLLAACASAADLVPAQREFFESHCTDCHDADTKKGGLDLTTLKADFSDAKTFTEWVKIHDRVQRGEMPPKKRTAPPASERDGFVAPLAASLTEADRARSEAAGRTMLRRLNRYEYENTVRDLLGAPWLRLKDQLPEDGEAFRFNKVSEALDISHVQMGRYLAAADFALRQVLAKSGQAPENKTTRYYARDQGNLRNKMKLGEFNQSAERATFPLLGSDPQPDVLDGKAPITVGSKDPATREKEAFGVVAGSYEPIEPNFSEFRVPMAGRYKLRFSAYSFWAGPVDGPKWWKPDRKKISAGRRDEPVVISAVTPPRLSRKLGSFDVFPEPGVQELDVPLLAGEVIYFDAARLFRSRPPDWHNPLAEHDGQPGVAFRWMEVEGPIFDQWPTAGHRLLFGDLPLRDAADKKSAEVISEHPHEDAAKLLHDFMAHAYRRPVLAQEEQRFLGVIQSALDGGSSFADAMIAGYSGVLCSPAFLCLEEKPGPLDDFALASRLSYFLWNTAPDDALRAAAAHGEIHSPAQLRAETERLLADPRARRFTDAFLAYWLDLRKADATSPDATLYPDYYLDDLLLDSAVEEPQLFFRELIDSDLPVRTVAASNFTFANERLGQHYGLPSVPGVQLHRVILPPDSVRGGMLTMASVLKVTANGTTTSPVIRGAWIMERILGQRPPPPPPTVPAVEPDTRGATTIRQQLEKHRTEESCSACHKLIDPSGFALESFDVLGGWRDKYRAVGEGARVPGFGKNGQPFTFHHGPEVDASGELPDGRKFSDVRELKRLLVANERQLARNLATQLAIYATGSPIRFADRAAIEHALDQTSASHYGVRSLIHEIIQSDLFRSK